MLNMRAPQLWREVSVCGLTVITELRFQLGAAICFCSALRAWRILNQTVLCQAVPISPRCRAWRAPLAVGGRGICMRHEALLVCVAGGEQGA